MIVPFLLLAFLLPLPGDRDEPAQSKKATWAELPSDQWPQIALINQITYTDKEHPVAGCAFLLETDEGIYAVTAKHVLTYFKSGKMDSIHFKGTLKRWKMFPKNNPEAFVLAGELLNEDDGEPIDKVSPDRDWLLFTVKERKGRIQPLRFRKTPLTKGEKVFILGWRYTDKNCTQRIHEGKVVKVMPDTFLVSTTSLADNTMPGLSGGPVIDDRGRLIGLMCKKSGKMELPASIRYPREFLGRWERKKRFIEAARSGDIGTVRETFREDPEIVNARDGAGMSALHWACEGGHLEVVRLLLKGGADVKARNARGELPLDIARKQGHAQIVECFGSVLDRRKR